MKATVAGSESNHNGESDAAPADQSRRRFVGWCAGAGTGAAVSIALGLGTAAPAAAQDQASSAAGGCESMTVWVLSPAWDTPRGPHGKTELKSKASLIAAKHRWALTETDALNMNLHKCSWAPAVPVQVRRKEFMEIWNHNGAGAYRWSNPWNNSTPEIFDTRCLEHIPDGDAIWATAMDASICTLSAGTVPAAATPVGTTATATTPSVTFTTATGGPVPTATTAVTVPTATTAVTVPTAGPGPTVTARPVAGFGSAPSSLAFTGSDSRVLGVWGTSLAAAGAGLVAFARRRRNVSQAALAHAANDGALKRSDAHRARPSAGLR